VLDRTVLVRAFPIGVDPDILQETAKSAQRSFTVVNLVQSSQRPSLMVGVDRLDYCKGLDQRFHAYERFLGRAPGKRPTVTFLQIAPPSRTESQPIADPPPSGRLTGHINGRFADIYLGCRCAIEQEPSAQ